MERESNQARLQLRKILAQQEINGQNCSWGTHW